jgi:hypothetical protein
VTRRRNIVAGGTYLIERCCAEPCFYTPRIAELRAAFLYCLAHASHLYDVSVSAYAVQPDRWQGVVTPRGEQLSPFLTWFHQYVSKCVHALLGTDREVWSPSRAKITFLSSFEETIDAITEVISAPTVGWLDDAGDVVELRSSFADVSSGPSTFARPAIHFRFEGCAEPTPTLELVAPPGLVGAASGAELRRALRDRTGGTPAPVCLVRSSPLLRRTNAGSGEERRESTARTETASMPLERMMELWCRAGSPPATEDA